MDKIRTVEDVLRDFGFILGQDFRWKQTQYCLKSSKVPLWFHRDLPPEPKGEYYDRTLEISDELVTALKLRDLAELLELYNW